MLLVLSEEHKVHLGFLAQVDVEGTFIPRHFRPLRIIVCERPYSPTFTVVKEFCKISLEFIRKGTNPKLYQSAGRECDLRSVLQTGYL